MKNKTDMLHNVINISQKTYTLNKFKLLNKNVNFFPTPARYNKTQCTTAILKTKPLILRNNTSKHQIIRNKLQRKINTQQKHLYKRSKTISVWKNKNKRKFQEVSYEQMKRKH